MSRAYVYAFLAFLSSSLKAVSDLLHLWHGRRATVRIRSELTAAIYDKALRRKDASGVVAAKEDEGDKGEKKEKKSNADTGKVVNLMAGQSHSPFIICSELTGQATRTGSLILSLEHTTSTVVRSKSSLLRSSSTSEFSTASEISIIDVIASLDGQRLLESLCYLWRYRLIRSFQDEASRSVGMYIVMCS